MGAGEAGGKINHRGTKDTEKKKAQVVPNSAPRLVDFGMAVVVASVAVVASDLLCGSPPKSWLSVNKEGQPHVSQNRWLSTNNQKKDHATLATGAKDGKPKRSFLKDSKISHHHHPHHQHPV